MQYTLKVEEDAFAKLRLIFKVQKMRKKIQITGGRHFPDVIESYNQRITWVRRDPEDNLVQMPLPWAII